MPRGGFAVFGDLNLDTTVNIDSFPVRVGDPRFVSERVQDTVGGTGASVACGLATLGHPVNFGSVIGHDAAGTHVLRLLEARGVSPKYIRHDWPATARRVNLVDADGNRHGTNDTKLANSYTFPENEIPRIVGNYEYVYVSTQPWCRSVAWHASRLGKKIAVDVQAIVDVDEYHAGFLKHADLVFFSTDRLCMHSSDFIRKLWVDYDVSVVVATHGADGATLGMRESSSIVHEPSHGVHPVVDTTGAGEAFVVGYLSALLRGKSHRQALTSGQVTAAYKISNQGATVGFPSRWIVDDVVTNVSAA